MNRWGMHGPVRRHGERSPLAARWISLAAVLAFFLAWEAVAALELVRPIFISSPSRIASAAVWLSAHGLWSDLAVSATQFGGGFVLAAALGIPFGLALGWSRTLHAIFDPFVSALYAMPRIALLPIIIVWLGIGVASKVAIVFLGAFFPIVINVVAGVRTLDPALLRCAYAFGASERQVFRTVALPGTVPFLIAGLRIGVGRGLVGVVVGEMVASTAGIGHMMSVAAATFQTDKVYVGILILAACGYSLNAGLRWLESRFESWRPEHG